MCLLKIEPLTKQCTRCGLPLPSGTFHGCGECIGEKMPFSKIFSMYPYHQVKPLVHKLKYEASTRARAATEILIERALESIPGLIEACQRVEGVVPMPMHWARRLVREFNHSHIIAQALSSVVGKPVLKVLKRTRNSPPQAGLSRRERMINVKDSFKALETPPANLLLVDDVATTLSTLKEAARTLKTARVQSVTCIVFARA